MRKKKYGVVLSGGGAKGCYQTGAWKALKELGVEFDAVVGASIGTINAAAMAQGDYKLAEDLWRFVKIQNVIDIPDEFVVDENIKLTSKCLPQLSKFVDSYFKKGGFDTNPLRELLSKSIDEDKVRSSGVDFGLITLNLSKWKAEELFIDDIPEGKLLDYIIASASFPLFKKTKINGNTFIDGGVADNIPFNMLKKRGYRNIIVLDISGVGKNKVPDITGTDTIYIKNSIDFGNFFNVHNVLDFSSEFIEQFMYLGYLDTMKAFDMNLGENYFIHKDKFLKKVDVCIRKELYFSRYKDCIGKDYINYKMPAVILLDQACLFLEIERIREYSFEELLRVFVDKYRSEDVGAFKKFLKKDLKVCADLLYEIVENEKILK